MWVCVRSQSTGIRECPAVKVGKQSHGGVKADVCCSAMCKVGSALDWWARIVLRTIFGLQFPGQDRKSAKSSRQESKVLRKEHFINCF